MKQLLIAAIAAAAVAASAADEYWSTWNNALTLKPDDRVVFGCNPVIGNLFIRQRRFVSIDVWLGDDVRYRYGTRAADVVDELARTIIEAHAEDRVALIIEASQQPGTGPWAVRSTLQVYVPTAGFRDAWYRHQDVCERRHPAR